MHDDSIQAPTVAAVTRACCCPARAVVRVVMPPTAARRHETDLLLCSHHYRVSREALAAAHATASMYRSAIESRSLSWDYAA
jgi:hypothetical protein